VHIANLISKERPGASKQALSVYLTRVTALEELAKSIVGVTKAFAVQSGREIRIMVDCAIIDDAKAVMLADDLAHRIENEMIYAGQIKITVIREFRAVDLAK
jgi:ribonucrease Y